MSKASIGDTVIYQQEQWTVVGTYIDPKERKRRLVIVRGSVELTVLETSVIRD